MLVQDAGVYPDTSQAPSAVRDSAAPRRARVARNILVILVSQIAIWVGGSGLSVLLPRYLGDANIGRLTFASSIVAFAMVVVAFGSDTYLTREVARRPATAPHLAFNALVSKIPLIIATGIGIAVFIHAFGYPAATRNVVYVMTAGMCFAFVANTLTAILQGLERMTLTSFASIIQRVMAGAFGVGAVALAGAGLVAYSLILVATSCVVMSILLVHFVRTVGISFRFDREACKALFANGSPFMVWSLALMVYGTIDITMLSLMTRDEVVGWYGTAYSFVGIATFFPSAMTFALLPNISSSGVAESRAILRRCLDIAMLLSVALTVFFFVGASAIIDFLGYPEGFRHTVVLLRILSLHIPLTTFSMIAGTVVVASNKEHARTKAAVIAAILNPLANIVAIPYTAHVAGDGAIGAAVTSVLIEVFMTAVMLALVPAGTFGRVNLSVFARALGAGAAMGTAMLVMSPYGLIPMMVLGGMSFGVVSLALGAVSLRELRELASTVAVRRAAA